LSHNVRIWQLGARAPVRSRAVACFCPDPGCPHGRNTATGESIELKASKKVAFRPAKDAI
jgi:hypothetical protein